MTEPYQLTENPTPAEPYVIDPGSTQDVPVSPDVAATRAYKAKTGMPKLDVSYDDMYRSIASGQEQQLREAAASFHDVAANMQRQSIISSVVAKKGGPLTQQENDLVLDLMKRRTKADPESIIEETYSHEFLGNVQKNGQSDTDTQWKDVDPKYADMMTYGGSNLMARQQVMDTYIEDLEQQVKNQSLGGYILDRAKEFASPYWQLNMRAAGAEKYKGDVAANIQEQAIRYNRMSFDDFKKTLKTDKDEFASRNPALALEWLKALKGQSNSEAAWNGLIGMVDTIPLIGPGTLLKGAAAIRNAAVARKAVSNAIKTAVESAARDDVTKAAMEEASGNLKEAGIKQATDEAVKNLKGTANPIADNLKSFLDVFNGDINELKNTPPGRLRREFLNRLSEQTGLNKAALYDAIAAGIKVERLPALWATENAMREAAEGMVGKYPELKDTILNARLRQHPETGSPIVDFTLGTNTAELFKDERQAKGFISTHGLIGAATREAEGVAPGFVRLYHGGVKYEGGPRFLTPDLQYAKGYASKNNSKEAFVHYVDLPEKSPYLKKSFDDTGTSQKAPYVHFEAPEDIAKQLRPLSELPYQKGNGFYVMVSKPVPENWSLLRDGLLSTDEAKTPESWTSAFAGGALGRFRTPEETLSAYQRMQRKAAVYGPNRVFAVINDMAKDIKQLSRWALPFTQRKQRLVDFDRIINAARDMPDPVTKEKGSIWISNPGDLDKLYMNAIQRLPDEQEIAAFYATKRLELARRTLRNFEEYKRGTKEGAGSHTLSVLDPATETKKAMGFKTIEFDGSRIDAIPPSENSVLLMGEKLGQEKIIPISNFKNKLRDQTDAAIKDGKQFIYKLLRPEERPFSKFSAKAAEGDAKIEYVISNKVKEGNLKFRDFGHLPDYDYQHAVKQAVIKIDPITKLAHYERDMTIGVFNSRAIAQHFGDSIEKIRTLLLENKEAEAQAFHATTKLPLEYSKIRSWFKPVISRGALGRYQKTASVLSKNDPIKVVPRTRMVGDIDKDLKTRYGDNLRDTTRKYGKTPDERETKFDVFEGRNEGTHANPLYSIKPASYLDPLATINRSLSKAVNSLFLNDYKTFSVEHWVQEAHPYINASLEDIRSNPYHHFYNPAWKNVAGDDVMRVNNLKTANLQIRQLLGVQDETNVHLHALGQKLSDSIYYSGNTGERRALTPAWLLPKLRDPIAFVRSIVFNEKLGLWNIPQLWVQSQTFATIFGIAGYKAAAPGTKAALLHLWSRVNANPEILDHLDKIASTRLLPGTHTFRPGEWKEARELFIKSGMDHVAGEHVNIDNPWHYDITGGEGSRILNSGQWFFREGERQVRSGAFYTAYVEYRKVNPTGAIGNKELQTIMNRADDLWTNMSRASASQIQQGVWSIPTQFLSYQARLAELFMGKRLTGIEKTRLLGTYAALYGVPTMFGLTSLPLPDYFRKSAIEHGYVVGNSYLESAVMEGIPSMLTAMATGNWYNIKERYGIQGFTPLQDLLRGDKTWWQVFAGASFGSLFNSLENASGFFHAMGSLIRRDGEFPMKFDDVLDLFKEVSSVQNTKKFISAMNTGKIISRKEGYVEDITPGNALFDYISGLSPQSAADTNLMTWTNESEKAEQKKGLSEFIMEYRRGIDAHNNNDPQQGADYMRRAFNILEISGYPMEKVGDAIALAIQNNTSTVDRIGWDYYNKRQNIPTSRKEEAGKALPKFLQQRIP